MRVYGHLRQEHSFSMVKRVVFKNEQRFPKLKRLKKSPPLRAGSVEEENWLANQWP